MQEYFIKSIVGKHTGKAYKLKRCGRKLSSDVVLYIDTERYGQYNSLVEAERIIFNMENKRKE